MYVCFSPVVTEYDYTLSSGALTQAKALTACKRDNKDLAMPKDADQVNKMRKYLEGAGLTHRAYVGVTDESQEDIWQVAMNVLAFNLNQQSYEGQPKIVLPKYEGVELEI